MPDALLEGQAIAVQLDDLSAAQIDDLPVGVIQLDRAGRVLLYNRAESRLSGLTPERVIGRDFFRDVAPCTHLPAFEGRFLEGVRQGQLNELFQFTFGLEPSPVRVEVRMHAAREPDRYWIVVRLLEILPPSRHREAARALSAVESRARAEPVDPNICEREPIHIPGTVQAHGVLLVCRPSDLAVEGCSDNVGDAFEGETAASVIGRALHSLLPGPLPGELRDGLAAGGVADPSRPLRRNVKLGKAATPFSVSAHLHGGRLLIELERVTKHPEDFGAATTADAQDAVARLRTAATIEDAARQLARDLRALTGFERVLVYRFDPDWNGESIAEDKVESWAESLLWLRFPASDIPAQARALYARSPGRFVVDRDAVPSAIAVAPQRSNEAVDLSFTQIRALSPIHLEYQRNLGVNGSMSLSILVEGRLWGLVIGHHRRPHYVTPESRSVAALITDAFALRAQELESLRLWSEQQKTLAAQNKLLDRMVTADDFSVSLTDGAGGEALLELQRAAGAAVISGGRVTTVGDTPAADELLALADWLRDTLGPERSVFATDQLSEHYARAGDLGPVASGVLAAFVRDGERSREHVLLWFRPEQPSTIVWGGNPNKPVLAESTTQTVLPRRSFERWVEERRGVAEPWNPWQLDTAAALSATIEGVVLRQGRRIVELTAKQEALTRALFEKDILAREIDHRVKNSLQIVAGLMSIQARKVADPRARAAFESTFARVMSVARVHDSLHQSDHAQNVDLGATLRRLCEDLAAGMTGAEQRLEVEAEPGLMVPSQSAVALSLIVTELVTNALKHAYRPGEPGRVEVSVKGRAAAGVEVQVCDAGRGMPAELPDRRDGRKGGLGMQVIRAMLSQIDAEMEVRQSSPGTCIVVRT